MATRFEVLLWGRDESYLRSAAEAALDEVHRLEAQMSFYRDDSDISFLNQNAAREAVSVDPRLHSLLRRAREISSATGGAFDITIAPLMRAWGMAGGEGRVPSDGEIETALAVTGMELIDLEGGKVRFCRPGVMLDLGAIGKGYAIEQAAGILLDHEIRGALIHGGTSTIQAIGSQPDGSPWGVAIQDPSDPEQMVTTTIIQDEAFSVSGSHGKSFTRDDVRYGHVIDPRTGRPTRAALLAAVGTASATDSDALSTALIVGGESLVPVIESTFNAKTFIIEAN